MLYRNIFVHFVKCIWNDICAGRLFISWIVTFYLCHLINVYTKRKVPQVQTWIQMSQGNGWCCSTTNKCWKSPLYLRPSGYVFPLCSAVTGKASAKVLGRFNLWIIMQLFLTIATILLLVQVTHSNVSFFDKNYAQTLVDADRTSLFLVDNRTNELYARIFDIGGSLEDSRSSNLQKEIRW